MDARKIAVSVLAVLVGLSVVMASPTDALIVTPGCEISLTGPVVINSGDSVFSITGFIREEEGLPVGHLMQTQTPASGCNDLCDGLPGAQYGLCNAYCEAMDCDSDVPMANPIACGKVLENFKNKSGGISPPCETCENTFVAENIYFLFCFVNGGNIGIVYGSGYLNGAGPYSFYLEVEDDTVDDYEIDIYDVDFGWPWPRPFPPEANVLLNFQAAPAGPVSGSISITLP